MVLIANVTRLSHTCKRGEGPGDEAMLPQVHNENCQTRTHMHAVCSGKPDQNMMPAPASHCVCWDDTRMDSISIPALCRQS